MPAIWSGRSRNCLWRNSRHDNRGSTDANPPVHAHVCACTVSGLPAFQTPNLERICEKTGLAWHARSRLDQPGDLRPPLARLMRLTLAPYFSSLLKKGDRHLATRQFSNFL